MKQNSVKSDDNPGRVSVYTHKQKHGARYAVPGELNDRMGTEITEGNVS